MTLVFLVEDLSMKRFLDGLLPRLVPAEIPWHTFAHNGKSDLESSLPKKLRAWRQPDTRFVVLRDKDSADCKAVKQRLAKICAGENRPALIRIACRELESWFLGDLAAVDRVFGTSLASQQAKVRFRDPDHHVSAQQMYELLPNYGKTDGARRLGPEISLTENRSVSFGHFVSGVRRLVAAPDGQAHV